MPDIVNLFGCGGDGFCDIAGVAVCAAVCCGADFAQGDFVAQVQQRVGRADQGEQVADVFATLDIDDDGRLCVFVWDCFVSFAFALGPRNDPVGQFRKNIIRRQNIAKRPGVFAVVKNKINLVTALYRAVRGC